METLIKSKKFNSVVCQNEMTIKTKNKKFDKWFSKDGGIVKGSSVFVTGTSGAGKTTLMVNLMNWLNIQVSSMYSREMISGNVKEQTRNIKLNHENAYIADSTTHENFEDYLKEIYVLKPNVIIIDSLQAIALEDYPNMSEEDSCNFVVSQLRKYVTENNAILFLIGHNTKDGQFAGRNTIMQFMDAHIEMVHHKKEDYRTISWGQKNRKGPLGTLYYIFGENSIEFFDEEEWELRNNGNETYISDLLANTLSNYFLKGNKSKLFKKTYNEELKKISKTCKSDTELAIEAIKIISKLENLKK